MYHILMGSRIEKTAAFYSDHFGTWSAAHPCFCASVCRRIVNDLIDQQLNDFLDEDIKATQERLNAAYDAFTAKYGLLNDRKNGRLFEQDSSYYLLCSLENLDEQGQLKSKAAMFTKRTIRPERTVTSVDAP